MGSPDDVSPGGLVALGIIVGLLSTSVQSLGLTLQRKSHILEDEKAPHEIRRPPYRRTRWQLGMGMFIAANILGSSVQISTLPLPVLSTLQASGLVFNSICATLILAEPFTRWSLCGTMLVCAGAVLIAVFGAIPAPAHDLSELLELLGRKPFVVWMILQGLLVVSVAVVTDCLNSFTNLGQDSRFRFARGLAYGCISGILSAHSLLVAKSAVELLIKTFSGSSNQFVHWQSWVLVLALITLALCQLYYLHRGLKLVSTSVLYPLVFCIYNIIAILDGLIYFKQTDELGPLRACLIALGTAILLSGVLALSWRLSDEQHTPGVGQSSLAPGLGLVEDTEGEEEEESLLGSDSYDDDEFEGGNAVPHTYSTFRPSQHGETTPLTPTARGKRDSYRWQERDEIWGELEDQENSTNQPPALRSRSNTVPAAETTALLPSRRPASGGSAAVDSEAAGPSSATTETFSRLRPLRRRRKSTGFPGFTARRHERRSHLTVQDALGGVWKLKWWRNRLSGNENRRDSDAEALASPVLSHHRRSPRGSTGSLVPWPAYTDEPSQGEQPGGGGTQSADQQQQQQPHHRGADAGEMHNDDDQADQEGGGRSRRRRQDDSPV